MAYTAATTSHLPFDVPVTLWLQGHLGGLASWFGAITALNGTRQTLAGILLLVVILIVNPRTILLAFLASMTGPIYSLVNALVMRPRPSAQLVQVSEHLGGTSFPSGHATFAATYATLLVLCLGGRYLHRRGLVVAAAAGATVVIIFSVARVVTGGHWPSDVLGGLLLAGGWISTLLSVRVLGDPVLKYLGRPEDAWHVRHPSHTPFRRAWGCDDAPFTHRPFRPSRGLASSSAPWSGVSWGYSPSRPSSGSAEPLTSTAHMVALALHSLGGARWIRMRPPVLVTPPAVKRI
jgi:membrane-associated phospholipid phosphatase